MPNVSIIPVSAEKLELGSEWQEAAELAAHNLGFPKPLLALSPEHWQMVLASVTDRMRLRGASLPIGWRRALTRQVGRGDEEDPSQGKVLALAARRKEIAAHVASELGLGDLAGLSPADRATVEQQTTETIEGCSADTDEPTDCSDADRTMRRLLAEHQALKEPNGEGGLEP
jgi:hypothetical protein